MGNITGSNIYTFKPATQLFSKVKREFASLGAANLINEADFPDMIDQCLKDIGVGVMQEQEAILTVRNNQAILPTNFKQLYAAYKCSCCTETHVPKKHFQNQSVFENDITCETLCRTANCKIHCQPKERVIERITIKQYVNEECIDRAWKPICLLKLSPNVKPKCTEDCLNLMATSADEITISNGRIYTNFTDGDIYLKYYGFPLDEDGYPMIIDKPEFEKLCEAYIKWKLFQDFWLMDKLQNAGQKMQYLEQHYLRALGDAQFEDKIPSFEHMLQFARTTRGTSMMQLMNQQDNNHYRITYFNR